MSANEKREALLHEIAAWREAADAHEEGLPQYRNFQNKMKLAEWKLNAHGLSEGPSGLVITMTNPDKAD